MGGRLAISFLEAPLKFRAPGVTLRIGLGIGRLVFRALNAAEVVLGVTLVAAIVAADATPKASVPVAVGVVVAVLLVQLAVVRPRLTRRADRILAGAQEPRSHAHYAYVALELVKVVALITTGTLLLAT
ncbi:hypothetical protein [Plantactinospora sp. KLBMP9567]|uniref:hypothetical protein n=1 Tax=Plantactinospora sp. KLBMP9567 TaxID=3085900 RepID=UPI0029819CB7|nr:hypothetical protein [Plantactinospora sp. KLBMP9567]MDW5326160.1 hypothetical protein [Plantactinospora sp. KLBMP9567]